MRGNNSADAVDVRSRRFGQLALSINLRCESIDFLGVLTGVSHEGNTHMIPRILLMDSRNPKITKYKVTRYITRERSTIGPIGMGIL